MKWSMKVVCCLAVLVSTLPVRGGEVEMPETLRVASVQIPIFNTPEENLGRILQGVSEAAEQGARIVLFPETALSGFVPEAKGEGNQITRFNPLRSSGLFNIQVRSRSQHFHIGVVIKIYI